MNKFRFNRQIILIYILFVSIIVLPNYSYGLIKDNYYGHLYTGDGTYIIFNVIIQNNHLENYIKILTDEEIININSTLDDEIRGNIPEKDLTSNDAAKISKAFKNNQGVKLKLIKSQLEKGKIQFITEKKKLEEGGVIEIGFDGIVRKNRIIGKIALDRNTYHKLYMEFRNLKE